MEEAKYEMTDETKIVDGRLLHRIRALRDIGYAREGEYGGWIERSENLSHRGVCWVSEDSCVYDKAEVSGDSIVFGNARIGGMAEIRGQSFIFNNTKVSGKAIISGNAIIFGDADISGNVRITGNAHVGGDALISCQKHLYWQENFSNLRNNITFFRTAENKIKVSSLTRYFTKEIDEFEKYMLRSVKGTAYEEDWRTIFEFVRRWIKLD